MIRKQKPLAPKTFEGLSQYRPPLCYELTGKSYTLVMDKFRSGTASVTDLNTARTESDNATQKYVRDIASFWNYYYTLRKLTLYDFLAGDDLEVDYEEMTQ